MKVKTEIELQVEQPLLELMESCETFCVAGCCGVDAFDVSKEQVGCWVSAQGQEKALAAAVQLHTLIEEVKTYCHKVTSDRFNAHWTPLACACWLSNWETALGEVLKKTE
jgi:hypothetical protein